MSLPVTIPTVEDTRSDRLAHVRMAIAPRPVKPFLVVGPTAWPSLIGLLPILIGNNVKVVH